MGYCSGATAPGFANAPGRGGFRQGFGQGGFGRGCFGGGFGRRSGGRGAWRMGFAGAAPYAPVASAPTPEMERQYLQQQAQAMESSLDAIKTRLAKLDDDAAQG